MPSSTRVRSLVPEAGHRRALIDTSVVIDLESFDATALRGELAVSTVTLAELAAGPHATADPVEKALRQDRLQRVEATFEALPVDHAVARAYGRVYAEVVGAGGRKARGRRTMDLLIAATALAVELPLYTANTADFNGLDRLVDVVAVSSRAV